MQMKYLPILVTIYLENKQVKIHTGRYIIAIDNDF